MRKFIALGKAQILVEFEQSLPLQKLQEALLQNEKSVSVSGLVGSAVSVVAASVFLSTHKSLLLVLSDKEKAAYHLNDLEQLLPDAEVLFFPSSHRRPYTLEETRLQSLANLDDCYYIPIKTKLIDSKDFKSSLEQLLKQKVN